MEMNLGKLSQKTARQLLCGQSRTIRHDKN